MKYFNQNLLMVFAIVNMTACSNNRQAVPDSSKTEPASNQASANGTGKIKQRITPSLWVDRDAKAVAAYYLSIFKDGKLKEYHQYKNPPEAKEQGGQDSFETAIMEIGDIEFNILAAGPYFKFNESVSFVINCKDQAEVDYYWNALTANGGQESSCGWCKDKYGLSWQVVPVEYFDLINSDDPAVRDKAMRNTLKQKKLILKELK